MNKKQKPERIRTRAVKPHRPRPPSPGLVPEVIDGHIIPKNLGGRPREWTEKEIAVETQELYKWLTDSTNYYFTSFLNARGLNPNHILRFCEYSPEFRKAFDLAKQTQEERLVKMAVSRQGDPGFIKFILQNKAGWKDKAEISGDAANPLAVILNKIGETAKHPLEDYSEDE